ncbi:M55 family metallopeptidase [Micromonospora sp. M12]
MDENTDAVLLIGYHARAGAGPAVLAHTISDAILDVRVAGRSLGEIGLNVAMAGHLDAPVVLLSGDDTACTEFSGLVPSAVTVAVKQTLGQTAAVALHPQEARRAAPRCRRCDHPACLDSPLKMVGPVDVEVDLYGPYMVDLAVLVPGVARVGGGRTVAFHAADFAEAYRLVQLLVHLASIKPG